jgi:hypothetical protein
MDEQHPDAQTSDTETSGPEAVDVATTADPDDATGVPEVDAVLASLDVLAERPVVEHVAVFEQAHERLRRALDAPSG